MAYHSRYTRELISWEEYAKDSQNTVSLSCNGDYFNQILWPVAISSLVMNGFCMFLVWRIPLLRGIVKHVLLTFLSNVRLLFLRQSVESGRIESENVMLTALFQQFVGARESSHLERRPQEIGENQSRPDETVIDMLLIDQGVISEDPSENTSQLEMHDGNDMHGCTIAVPLE